MTKSEARKVLGVGPSASRKAVEQAYHKKQREHRLRQMPGNPLKRRQEAYQQSVKVNAAWKLLSQAKQARSRTSTKRNAGNTAANTPNYTPTKPHNMADAWDSVADRLPFSKRTTTVVTVTVVVAVIITALSSLL